LFFIIILYFFQNPHHVLGARITVRRLLERPNGEMIEKALAGGRVIDQVGLLRLLRRLAGLHQRGGHGAIGAGIMARNLELAKGLAVRLFQGKAAQLDPGGIDVDDAVGCGGRGDDEGGIVPVVGVLQDFVQGLGQSSRLALLRW